MDAENGKVARNGGYLCGGRGMASGGRFYGSLSWYSRGVELCVERRCSRIGGCGCLASANVLEDRGDDIEIFDADDDAQFAAALGAGLDVDGEDAFRAPHSGHGGKGLIRLFVARLAFWHDGLTMFAIRREHAVEPGEVQSRTRDQRRRAGDEVEWVEDDVGGAVAKRLLEPSISEAPAAPPDLTSTFQLQAFLREALPGHNFTSGQFLSGFESRIMQANDDMFAIATLIKAQPALYEVVIATPARRLMTVLRQRNDTGEVLEAIDTYLATYGHQGYSLDFGEPTQQEDPSAVFVTLKNMVQRADYDPARHGAEATRKRGKALAEIRELLEPFEYWQFRYRMWFAYQYYPMREESGFVLGTAWPALRRIAAELGQRLVDVGTLSEPDDLYFLTSDEIKPALAARGLGKAMPEYLALTADRRELREARKRLHPPGTIPEEASENPGVKFKETQFKNDDSSDTLRGIPVSPGTITAPASRIMNAQEFDRMQPGSILVCPMTSPAWTQLFAHAVGLVTDIGGILGHGSIVAREYGIPAVVGTGNVTRRIESGQTLEVDGDAGTVVIQTGD